MGKTAIVTGGVPGLGKAIAVLLRDSGHRVAANYLYDEDEAQQCHREYGIEVFQSGLHEGAGA